MANRWTAPIVADVAITTGGERFIQTIVLRGARRGDEVLILGLIDLEGLAAASLQNLRIRRGGSGLGGTAVATMAYLPETSANSRTMAIFALDNVPADDQDYSLSGTSVGANQIARFALLFALSTG